MEFKHNRIVAKHGLEIETGFSDKYSIKIYRCKKILFHSLLYVLTIHFKIRRFKHFKAVNKVLNDLDVPSPCLHFKSTTKLLYFLRKLEKFMLFKFVISKLNVRINTKFK